MTMAGDRSYARLASWLGQELARSQGGVFLERGASCDLAARELPESTTHWRAAVRVDRVEGGTQACVGVSGAFLRSENATATLSAPIFDHHDYPVRLWLEAEHGRVRLKVASGGEAWIVHVVDFRCDEKAPSNA